MLLWIINISVRLVNGSTAIVKEFNYGDNHVVPNLPTYIIIHFDDYTGPPFITGEGQVNGYQKLLNGGEKMKMITLENNFQFV